MEGLHNTPKCSVMQYLNYSECVGTLNHFNNYQFQTHFSVDVGRFENIGILRENKDLILEMGPYRDPGP